jgi:radical SAM protein with 4Fe4S-binding SPASM domain
MEPRSLGFVIVAKVTLACNLRCRYCYCSHKHSPIMSRETLSRMLYSAAQLDAANVEIVWHGGEPLLAGRDFYVDAVRIQREVGHLAGITFTNSIQTNATLVTAEDVAFFHDHEFKVGISMDGYRALNDRHRQTAQGGSVYDRTVESYRRLRAGGVTPGILAVLDLDDLPDVARFVEWLIELDCTSIGFNLKYDHRMTRHDGRYAGFLRALAEEIRAKRWRVAVRELLPEVTAQQTYDACHPGWPCHKTIAAVDEKGYIYFGCDRFMAGELYDSRQFSIGHVDRGFRDAFASPTYARLAAGAERELALCRERCTLFERCQGGCIADRMVHVTTHSNDVGLRWATAYCAGQQARKEVMDRV